MVLTPPCTNVYGHKQIDQGGHVYSVGSIKASIFYLPLVYIILYV